MRQAIDRSLVFVGRDFCLCHVPRDVSSSRRLRDTVAGACPGLYGWFLHLYDAACGKTRELSPLVMILIVMHSRGRPVRSNALYFHRDCVTRFSRWPSGANRTRRQVRASFRNCLVETWSAPDFDSSGLLDVTNRRNLRRRDSSTRYAD